VTKLTAVSLAIAGELTAKGWWRVDHQDSDAKLGETYHYTETSLPLFLIGVRDRLQVWRPVAYSFRFDAAFVRQALGMTVAQLVGAVSALAKTTASFTGSPPTAIELASATDLLAAHSSAAPIKAVLPVEAPTAEPKPRPRKAVPRKAAPRTRPEKRPKPPTPQAPRKPRT
jgi:hypothetical protein